MRARQTWRQWRACASPPRYLKKPWGGGTVPGKLPAFSVSTSGSAQGLTRYHGPPWELSAERIPSPGLSISCLQYVAWVELVIISLVTPNASFLGHLAGILAGLFHVAVVDRSAGDHVPCLQQAHPCSPPASAPSLSVLLCT